MDDRVLHGLLKGPSAHFSETIPVTEKISKLTASLAQPSQAVKRRLAATPRGKRHFEAVPGVPAIRDGKLDPLWVKCVFQVEDSVSSAMSVATERLSGLNDVNEDISFLRSSPLREMLPMGHDKAQSKVYQGSYSREELSMFREMCADLWTHFHPADFTHPKNGTTSPPFWAKDVDEKEAISLSARNTVGEDWYKKAVIDGDYETMAKRGMYFYSFLQRRFSPERPDKVRTVHTGETLLKGLDPVPADKLISENIDYSMVPSRIQIKRQFATYRPRPVTAVSSSVNWPYGYALNMHIKGFMYRYANTFRVLRAADIDKRLMHHSYPVAIDFSEFDKDYQMELVDIIFEEMGKVCPEYMVAHLRRTLFSANFSPDIGGGDKIWMGHPLAINSHSVGLPSGVILNIIMGRLKGAFSMVAIAARAGLIELSDWQVVMKGKHSRVSFANMTDDCLFFLNYKADAEKLSALFKEEVFSDIGNIQEETPVMFAGMIIADIGPGLVPRAFKRPSAMLRALTPERSNDLRSRPFAREGWRARIADYVGTSDSPPQSTPAAAELLHHVDKAFFDTYGKSLLSFIPEGFSSTAKYEAQLLDDPSRINWDPRFDHLTEDERSEFAAFKIPAEDTLARFPYLKLLSETEKSEPTI